MKAASVPSHRRRPTGLTPTIGFGQVRRVSPEVVQIGVRTPDAWLRFESTVGGAENLFEQLGAALGHGLNAGGRLRLAELENLMAHAKADRLRLLALAGELTQARTELDQAHAAQDGGVDFPPASAPIAPIEKTRPFFEAWKASGKFLRPFLAEQGQLANYQMWMHRFRLRLREQYQAHVGALLHAHNRNGSPRPTAT